MKTLKSFFILAMTSLTLISLTSCKKDDDGPGGNGNEGSFKVAMTDSPAEYAGLNVEIKGVSVYSEAAGWTSLSSQTKTYNVLSLTNGKEAELNSSSSGKVRAGTYTKCMIIFGDHFSIDVFGDASLGGIWADGVATFDMTYEGDKTVILDISHEVDANTSAKVLLDFDAASSIKEDAGNYVLKPVMREIKDAATGVKGSVSGAASALIQVTGNGETYSAYVSATGEFMFRGLKSGAHNITAYPVDDFNPLTPPKQPKTISGFIVAEGEIKSAGVIQF